MNPITIVEVSPRDGIQNEPIIKSSDKINLIIKLIESGIKTIEITSFVSSRVPQFYDAEYISITMNEYVKTNNLHNVRLFGLVPNEQGMIRAVQSGIKHIAIFTSVSEEFNKKNIGCTIEESFCRFVPVMKLAQENNIYVRGYLSSVTENIFPCTILKLTTRLLDMGINQVVLADTLGIGTPPMIKQIITFLLDNNINASQLGVHFHNTNGNGLPNIKVALDLGITTIDSSIGNIGGCPFAQNTNLIKPISMPNVSTGSLVDMLNNMGMETGIDLEKINELELWLDKLIVKTL